MKFTTQRIRRGAGLALGAASRARPRLLVALFAATFGLGLSVQTSAMAADMAQNLRVGHTVKTIMVRGSYCDQTPTPTDCPITGEYRPVDVQLWYPADGTSFDHSPHTVYRSWLYGKQLTPGPWDPLSWQVESAKARENASIDPNGPAFPVIVFSHGSTNDPIDYAYMLERIAAAGFVVAAPAHVNNTQDDERIDFINGLGAKLDPSVRFFNCRDGRPSPCSRGNVRFSMTDRARDISKVLAELPNWFGDRVDMHRVGVMGHSRGTVTALAAAGGSTTGTDGVKPWGFGPVPGVKAVMGLAIGAKPITSAVDLANITVPTLLVAGGLDMNPGPAVSQFAYDRINSTDKAFVLIPNAVHRSFDSTYCDELKSAGA
jgi:pimeloyl-ACP methyl ester carboxylesterase